MLTSTVALWRILVQGAEAAVASVAGAAAEPGADADKDSVAAEIAAVVSPRAALLPAMKLKLVVHSLHTEIRKLQLLTSHAQSARESQMT